MSDSGVWYKNARTIAAVAAIVFAGGGWVYTQDGRVSALEARLKEHSSTPLRLQKLETVQTYIRKDIREVKKAVGETNKLLQGLDKRLDNVYGRSSR